MHSHTLKKVLKYGSLSLNPCCNGRCTRTDFQFEVGKEYEVLILVVMEDALALETLLTMSNVISQS